MVRHPGPRVIIVPIQCSPEARPAKPGSAYPLSAGCTRRASKHTMFPVPRTLGMAGSRHAPSWRAAQDPRRLWRGLLGGATPALKKEAWAHRSRESPYPSPGGARAPGGCWPPGRVPRAGCGATPTGGREDRVTSTGKVAVAAGLRGGECHAALGTRSERSWPNMAGHASGTSDGAASHG